MALTTIQRRNAARYLVRQMFPPATTANLNLDDVLAAIAAVDDLMDLTRSALPATGTIKAGFIAALPEPFKTNSTAAQKAAVLALWAQQEAGQLPTL